MTPRRSTVLAFLLALVSCVALACAPATRPTSAPFPFGFWKSSAFDAATLPLSGWWQAGHFNGTTWAGSASAGTSGVGSHALTNSSNFPTVGPALSGHTTVSFAAASSQFLSTTAVAQDLLSATTYSGWCLFRPTSIASDNGVPGNMYLNDALLATTAEWWVLGLRSTGPAATLTNYPDGVQASTTPLATWSAVFFRWKNATTTIEMRVNKGAVQSATAAAIQHLVDTTFRAGWNGSASYYNGLIADAAVSQ